MADIFDLFKQIAKPAEETSLTPVTHLVVGLGNPGEKYSRTRHNAGYMAMDFIAEKYNLPRFRSKFRSVCVEAALGTHRALFMKPETYMNASGEAVSAAASFYKIPPENIIVLCDDINLDPGALRIRASGSDGGQRGLRSIIEHLGTDAFPRLRIGVGAKPSPDYDLANWVLGEIPKACQEDLFDAISRAADALPIILDGRINDAISKYNGKCKKSNSANAEKEVKPDNSLENKAN